MERTLFIIKPDGVKRGLIGNVLTRIEQRGFVIEKLEIISKAPIQKIDKHYEDLISQPFYPLIQEYMISGPIVIGTISGTDVISSWRRMMGETRPNLATPGTIRGDFGKAPVSGKTIENIVHGSDSIQSAEKEISLWFS
ncbi:nucleoside-diphosphate kinase (plasmid) [Lactococcus garvieae]|uniref:nucleoside-diphosphate kinase n=1 Tax=Lactococcus garvieae TaxID=1363 RepID=UPI0030CE1802